MRPISHFSGLTVAPSERVGHQRDMPEESGDVGVARGKWRRIWQKFMGG